MGCGAISEFVAARGEGAPPDHVNPQNGLNPLNKRFNGSVNKSIG